MKRRVQAYFEETGLNRHADAFMFMKTIFWFAFTWTPFVLIITQTVTGWATLPLWMMQGYGLASVGFNVGHDAIHQAYSKRPIVNSFFSWAFDSMGASSYTWSVSHNIVHHTYTNIVGVDDDLEPGPTMLFYEAKPKPWHRFQHLFCWFLYGFTGLVWVYLKDFEQIRRVDPRTGKKALFKDVVQMLIGKSLHVGLLVVLPLVLFGPSLHWIVGYIMMQMVAGATLAIVFQLAHVVEGVDVRRLPEGTVVGDGWADHQMRTTANFGVTRLSTFLTGGLDHQIEHHLFPRVCHVHYRKIAPIVKKCAEDHGLPYVHSGSFFLAVKSHARLMKRLGRGESANYPYTLVGADDEAMRQAAQ